MSEVGYMAHRQKNVATPALDQWSAIFLFLAYLHSKPKIFGDTPQTKTQLRITYIL